METKTRPYISKSYDLRRFPGMDKENIIKHNIYLSYYPPSKQYVLLTEWNEKTYYDLLEAKGENNKEVTPQDVTIANYETIWPQHGHLLEILKEKLTPCVNEISQKKKKGEPIYYEGKLLKDGGEIVANDFIIDIIFDLIESLINNYERKTTPHLMEYINFKEYILHPSETIKKYAIKENQIRPIGSLEINNKNVPILLNETPQDKFIIYKGIKKDMDLILNFNYKIGQIKEKDQILYNFKFKFTNEYFNITKSTQKGLFKAIPTLPNNINELLRVSIANLPQEATSKKELPKEYILRQLFDRREKIPYAQKELGHFLATELNIILRRGLNVPYMANPKTKGFDPIESEDIMDILYKLDLFTPNSISLDDIDKALTFISQRIKPTPNIIKFKNGLFNMATFEGIKTDTPILTLKQINFNYNPQAKGEIMKPFLISVLKQKDDNEEQIKERLRGFLEVIGYLLTDGNKLNAWILFTGIGGGGKGTTLNIITELFGVENVSSVNIHEMNYKNRFATSGLINKQLNIMTETSNDPLKDTSLIKAITGFDNIPIEEKGKTKAILPKEEVPHTITSANNPPKCVGGWEDAVLQRMVIIEFLNKFRNTDKQNSNMLGDILEDPQNMEWLIYNSIQAYKDMVSNGRDFINRTTPLKTSQLLSKHEDPIRHILKLMVKYTTEDISEEEPISTKELNQIIVYYGEQMGVNITRGTDGLINKTKLIQTIRHEFELSQDYKTEPRKIKEKDKYGNIQKNPLKQDKLINVRIYPQLYKTPLYNEVLNEMYKKGAFKP